MAEAGMAAFGSAVGVAIVLHFVVKDILNHWTNQRKLFLYNIFHLSN